jgi:N-acetylglucosaminyl-diphospho-decaprenol L-rhamnosyltransferase
MPNHIVLLLFLESSLIMFKTDNVVFSLVSHGQLHLVKDFLRDFQQSDFHSVEIILTLNIPEDESALVEFQTLPIKIVRNATPKGFGANHNFAFSMSKGDVFVIVNPDIRLRSFRLETLLDVFKMDRVGACAPVVLSSSGAIEDSARHFPSVRSLFKRALFGRPGAEYTWAQSAIKVDWTAGMFVAFRPVAFEQVGGFDEGYFLYYEDADICRRLAKNGWSTMLQPATTVVHDAQRASRHSRQHLKWHLASIFRFIFLTG